MSAMHCADGALPQNPAHRADQPQPENALRIELRPHRSLDKAGANYLIASVAVVTFAAAGLVALQGCWPALVFAALEVAAVYFALRFSLRAREDLHSISVDDKVVTILITERGRSTHAALVRHWTRVRLQPAPGWQPTRLLIEGRGRVFEVGTFLTDTDRRAVAAALSRLIGRIGESPDLNPALTRTTGKPIEATH